MGEISNKTLAGLVILAILISLVGLFVGRGKIITVGQATETSGSVGATVSSNVDIELEGSISIGDTESVYNNQIWSSENLDDCTFLTGSGLDAAGCTGTLSTTERVRVYVEGASPVNIGYRAASALFAQRYAGGANSGIADEAFQLKWLVTGVAGGLACNSGYAGTSTWSADNTFGEAFVGGTSQALAAYCVTNDELYMYLGIKVPGSEGAGPKTSTIWFEATSAV